MALQCRCSGSSAAWAGEARSAPQPAAPAAGGQGLVRRRDLAASLAGTGLVLQARQALALNMPAAMDDVWTAVGGGQADLFFPDQFLGTWAVESTLTSVKLPLGPAYVPDLEVVHRAMDQDLNKPIAYRVRYVRNAKGRVVMERSFNMRELLGSYHVTPRAITWSVDDPNAIRLSLNGSRVIRTRVTRRSEQATAADMLETSEYVEQEFDTPESASPRLKASQCFTKYRWRARAEPSQPLIVATQVVSTYLTPYDLGEQRFLETRARPVEQFTYRMAFRQPPPGEGPPEGAAPLAA